LADGDNDSHVDELETSVKAFDELLNEVRGSIDDLVRNGSIIS